MMISYRLSTFTTYTHYKVFMNELFFNIAEKHVTDFVEAVIQRCSVKKVFLEISQNLQENTCARVSFLIKLQASDFAEACIKFRSFLQSSLLRKSTKNGHVNFLSLTLKKKV